MSGFEWLSGIAEKIPRLSDASHVATLHFGSDVVIAACYAAVGAGIIWFLRQRPDFFAANRVHAWLCGVFVLAGALSHLVDAVTFWHPISAAQGAVKLITAAVSLAIVAVFWPLLPVLATFPSIGEMEEANRRLRREADLHETTLRELEAIHRDLEARVEARAREISEVMARFETALRGGKVYAFSQDAGLRYTWAYSPYGDRTIADMLGRTDEETFGPQEQRPLALLKRQVLESGEARDGEISLQHNGAIQWYDVHLEPLPDPAGAIVGLAGAAVDITERKQNEAHLRLLMRELTHRSKNLLAVIQAMARQTARHVRSTDEFLDQFGARLQALATSHDLLVQESWYGASLTALTRLQLGHYLDSPRPQISIEGPPVLLRPEAAQSIGLALHELATNAAKYGALSVPGGHVAIRWRRRGDARASDPAAGDITGGDTAGADVGPGDIAAGDAVEISWAESRGPNVTKPERRGFGSLVVEKNLARALDADVRLDFDPAGVRCRIVIPPAHLIASR